MSTSCLISEALDRAGYHLTGLSNDEKEKLLNKAKELLRSLNGKLPMGSLKKAEICRHIFVIEISLKLLSINQNSQSLRLQTGAFISGEEYKKCLSTCKKILNVHDLPESTMDMMCISCNCSSTMRKIATCFYDLYKRLICGDKQTLSHLELNTSVYLAGCLFIANSEFQIKLDKRQLALAAEVDLKVLTATIDLIEVAIRNSEEFKIIKHDYAELVDIPDAATKNGSGKLTKTIKSVKSRGQKMFEMPRVKIFPHQISKNSQLKENQFVNNVNNNLNEDLVILSTAEESIFNRLKNKSNQKSLIEKTNILSLNFSCQPTVEQIDENDEILNDKKRKLNEQNIIRSEYEIWKENLIAEQKKVKQSI
eukprot:gene8641-11681_t